MTTPIYLPGRLIFKPESCLTRSLPDVPAGVVFTPVEQKLIRLGLNPAAQPGEIDVCAIKLIASLRRRGATAEQLVASFTQATWRARELSAVSGYVIQFGEYKGKSRRRGSAELFALGTEELHQRTVQPAPRDAARAQRRDQMTVSLALN